MNSFKLTLLVLAAVTFALTGCGQSTETTESPEPAVEEMQAPTAAPAPSLATLLASNSRAADDRARDENRKPAEVIEFLGITPGMSVIDIFAAGGYYTEVLSLAVGSAGRVVAQNPAFILQIRDGAMDTAISERLAGNRLPNVERQNVELDGLASAGGPYDAAITALNYHDIYNRGGEEAAIAAFRAVYNVLKPDGVFGVIDHEGAEGNDNEALHRGRKVDAIRVAEAAGFIVDGDSGILHNHNDDMSLMVFDEAIRGKTNRFLLRLKRPSE